MTNTQKIEKRLNEWREKSKAASEAADIKAFEQAEREIKALEDQLKVVAKWEVASE